MRVLTVAELKRGGDKVPRRDYPTDNSVAWHIWNALKADAGHVVSLKPLAEKLKLGRHMSDYIEQLRNVYGLDIRHVSRKGRAYVLAGEWFGSHYTEYCAMAFKEGERK